MTARPLSELVEPGWGSALEPVAEQVTQVGQFLRAEIAAGRTYLPAGRNVLRAFTFPFDDVRVLIVGQDPYPTPGHAVGLSFSVAPEVRPIPRSLANIFDEYAADLGYPKPLCGDLTPWAERGVLLLNRVLTVRPSNPASHRGKGWEMVTECAIRALVARSRPMVAILWGRDASTLNPCWRQMAAWRSSRRILRRFRRRAGSSGRVRSAEPTSYSLRWAPIRSTGACPDRDGGSARTVPRWPGGARRRARAGAGPATNQVLAAVHAAAITFDELTWEERWTRDGVPQPDDPVA